MFDLLVVLFACGAIYEWLRLVKPSRSLLFKLAGIAYIGLTPFVLISLQQNHVLFLFIVVWGTDTGAYIFGRLFGGPKLFPRISPNKTWAGAIGGIVLGVGIPVLLALILQNQNLLPLIVFIALQLAILSEIGDLLESAIKRRFQVKDSGWFIPGHGGILDRIDGLLLAAPVYAGWHIFLNHSGL